MTDATWTTVCLPAFVICLAVVVVAVKMQQRKDQDFHEATGKRFDYAPGKITEQPVVLSAEDGPTWGRGDPQPDRRRWAVSDMLTDTERDELDRLKRAGSTMPFWDLFHGQRTFTDRGALPDLNISRTATNETRSNPIQADPFPEKPKPKGLGYIPLEPHTGHTQAIKPARKTELPWYELPKEDD